MWVQFDKDEGEDHRQRLGREFTHVLFPLLRAVTLEVAIYLLKTDGYTTTITCVERTLEENKAVGGYEFSGHLKRD